MEQDNTAGQQAAIPSTAELELRHYEARLGFWKVFWGTFIVGLAGITIPGVISFFTVYSENERNRAELILSQEAAHQQYIRTFLVRPSIRISSYEFVLPNILHIFQALSRKSCGRIISIA